MRDAMFAMAVALLTAEGIGCQAPTVVVVEREEVRKVVAWRLVERTYGETDPALTLAGDGDIPGVSKRLIYEPVYAERRAREYGCVRVRTACEHEIRLRILGGLARAVGESVTAECRIEGPEDLYHEIVIEPTAEGMELLEVRGLSRGNLRPGHYLIRGDRPFEMVFTSRQAGRGTMEITILQERGGTGAGQWAGGADLVDRHR